MTQETKEHNVVYGVCTTSVIDKISVGYMAQRSNVRKNGQISEWFTVLKGYIMDAYSLHTSSTYWSSC